MKENKRRNYSFHLLTDFYSDVNVKQSPISPLLKTSHTHTHTHTAFYQPHITRYTYTHPHSFLSATYYQIHTQSFLSATYYQICEEKISNRKKTVTKTTKSLLFKRQMEETKTIKTNFLIS